MSKFPAIGSSPKGWNTPFHPALDEASKQEVKKARFELPQAGESEGGHPLQQDSPISKERGGSTLLPSEIGLSCKKNKGGTEPRVESTLVEVFTDEKSNDGKLIPQLQRENEYLSKLYCENDKGLFLEMLGLSLIHI